MADQPIGAEYLAAFFDGEGCVSLQNKYAKNQDPSVSARVLDGLSRARMAGKRLGRLRKEIDISSVSHLSNRAAAKVLGVCPDTVRDRRAAARGTPLKKKTQAKNNHILLRLILVNTHLPTLQAIQAAWGGKMRQMFTTGNRKPTFSLTWSGHTARPVIEAMLPHAIQKRPRLELAQAFLNLRTRARAERCVDVVSGGVSRCVKRPEAIAEEQDLRRQLLAFNKRGVA